MAGCTSSMEVRMNNKTKNHNGEIGLLKFLFSLLILSYHLGNNFGKFKYGYIAVEFFFIVSGFYLCKSAFKKNVSDKDISNSSFSFIVKKIIRFTPYYILLFIFALPVWIFIDHYSLDQFLDSIAILLFIPNNSGNYSYSISMITWYINAMLLVEFIIYPLLLKFKDKIIYLISPLVIFFLFCFLMINYGFIGGPWQTATFCFKGVVRALMDINIGILIYGILDKLKDIKLTDFSRFLLTLLEIIGYILIAILSNKNRIVTEIIMLLIITLCLLVTLSEKDYLYESLNNKFSYYLEKLSLPIYIFQFIFIDIILFLNKRFSLNLGFTKLFVILILVSIIWGIIILKIFDFFNKNKNSIKKIFIKE